MATQLIQKFSILAFLILSSIVNGQSRIEKAVDELKFRETIIIVETAPLNITGNLKAKGHQKDLDDVLNLYEEFNISVKNMIETFWKFGKRAKYMTWDEFDRMDKETKKNYAILYYETVKPMDNSFIAKKLGYLELDLWMKEDEFGMASYNTLQTFNIGKAEDLNRGKLKLIDDVVFSMQLPELIPSGISIAFGLKEAQLFFKNPGYEIEERLPTLKYQNYTTEEAINEKTLYIYRGWFSDELDFNDFKYLYRNPIKLVSLSEIEEAVFLQDPNVIYYFVEPKFRFNTKYKSMNFNRYIVDAQTGDVLFYSQIPSTFTGKLSKSLYEINEKFINLFITSYNR